MSICIECGNHLAPPAYRYCSNHCQNDYQYSSYLSKWRQGEVDGSRGVKTRNISSHLRRYLFEKYDSSCSECRRNKRNPTTSEVPLEIDHIDGNSENNNECNLWLLCPNCHALTPTFRNLNKGRGRAWRRSKYLKSS